MMKKMDLSFPVKWILVCLLAVALNISCGEEKAAGQMEQEIILSPDNEGIKVPEGFNVIKIADSLGKPRHIAVNHTGGVYVKLREPVGGKGILYLEDTDGDGKVDSRQGFASYGGLSFIFF